MAIFPLARTSLTIPTYDGSGLCIHPSVVDFGSSTFRGFRYWMAFTPYTDVTYERPSLVCSNDGVAWSVPSGLTNPIANPYSGQTVPADTTAINCYLNDPELVYDPVADALRVYFGYFNATPGALHLGTSGFYYRTYDSDGALAGQEPYEGTTNQVIAGQAGGSPVIERLSATDWRMWFLNGTSVGYRTSTDGISWSAATNCSLTFPTYAENSVLNHMGGFRDSATGTLHLSLNCRRASGAYLGGDSEYIMLTTVDMDTPTTITAEQSDWFMEPFEVASKWASRSMYRVCGVFDDYGNMRIWASGLSGPVVSPNPVHIAYSEGYLEDVTVSTDRTYSVGPVEVGAGASVTVASIPSNGVITVSGFETSAVSGTGVVRVDVVRADTSEVLASRVAGTSAGLRPLLFGLPETELQITLTETGGANTATVTAFVTIGVI